jgi:hypothetical protein
LGILRVQAVVLQQLHMPPPVDLLQNLSRLPFRNPKQAMKPGKNDEIDPKFRSKLTT